MRPGTFGNILSRVQHALSQFVVGRRMGS